MNGNQRLWHLIARKMAGEAFPDELRELHGLVRDNPELQSFMDVLTRLWGPAEKQSEPQVQLAYTRHLRRLEQKTKPKASMPIYNGVKCSIFPRRRQGS